MDRPFYDFQIGAQARSFSFISEGPRTVAKQVIYAETTLPDFFNLALADIETDGSPNFYSVRNNGDLERIMATVAQTLLVFFRSHPRAKVAFTGSTPARTRLYQIILAREMEAVAADFVLSGVKENTLEDFRPNRDYDGFVITLRSQ